MTAFEGGGGTCGNHQGIQILFAPPGDGDLLLIHRAGDLVGGRQLSGGGQEFVMVKGSVEEDDKNPQQVICGAACVRIFP